MSVLAAVLLGVAVLLWQRPGTTRLAGLRLAGPVRRATPSAARRGARLGRCCASGMAGAVIVVLLGGGVGLVPGFLLAGATFWLLGRLEPASVRERRRRLVADLPLAADLLASCLRAGQAPERSIQVIASALGGPLGKEFGRVAANLRLGADARSAWSGFLAEPALAAFGRAMVRSARSGLPLADLLERLAQDARRVHRSAAERRAHAVGVHAAAPLGLCFLPAFVLVGIVPVVAAAVTSLVG